MTDTDLITAGGSSDNGTLPDTVNSDTSDAPTSTPTAETAPTADVASGDRSSSLSTMVLPELRALAKEIGVEGASGMRKGELVAAIRERRQDSDGGSQTPAAADKSIAATASDASTAPDTSSDNASTGEAEKEPRQRRERRTASRGAGAPGGPDAGDEGSQDTASENTRADGRQDTKGDGRQDTRGDRRQDTRGEGRQDTKGEGRQDTKAGGDQQRADRHQGDQQQSDQQGGQQNRGGNAGDDDGEGRGGRRGRRFRDRKRRERGGGEGGGDAELRDDDVVQPVAGILDVLDNYAFVRTSGYLAGPNDVYVSMNMVRKNGLRRGDAVTGAVRVPKDGEQTNQRQKFNPLVRLDSVNGGSVEDAKKRPEFGKLTPLYPNQRLRLETTPDKLTTRVIDLIMPIGKGQRALIVSPPKAGKTTIMQDIANAITRNNPECHLMVVLVDERPEEVTDMQRSVKGEVIASTFDRPPSDHTQAAELAIERAKRLVEQGKDVVVLLDSITRLGRAYNNASPASGRILSGGVDSTALYPPKRFLGAARNIEEGGSLTIIATAMVETGSTGDTVIFEEFKGTGNAELKLDRKIAERRVFPAVDVNPSGTRKDELLLSTDEFAVVHKLRRVLSGLDPHQAIDLLMSQLRKTKNNYEFLVQVSKTAPGSPDAD
ncbi:transcription termination factor Rho [Mycobacterium sp. IDR2000157661]|uniref:transcription termination factor Rho n=1 Tax=Mycobacterium sp. IDR2000157661 TaxID=2867005 RepID=UPI001EEAC2D8|nr:transcription termination factor Rho [Mycobacterium sp. IDR2000157661]ULE31588.1 transcription termination factor Rho [Mycobacterium sp. IDR2000157661]